MGTRSNATVTRGRVAVNGTVPCHIYDGNNSSSPTCGSIVRCGGRVETGFDRRYAELNVSGAIGGAANLVRQGDVERRTDPARPVNVIGVKALARQAHGPATRESESVAVGRSVGVPRTDGSRSSGASASAAAYRGANLLLEQLQDRLLQAEQIAARLRAAAHRLIDGTGARVMQRLEHRGYVARRTLRRSRNRRAVRTRHRHHHALVVEQPATARVAEQLPRRAEVCPRELFVGICAR